MTTNYEKTDAFQKLNVRQNRAIDKLVKAACNRHSEAGEEVVYTVKVEATDYGTAWVSIDSNIPSLSPGNALRSYVVSHGHWFVAVGKRGALTAYAYPPSLDHFAGSRWLGINIAKS